MRFNICMLLILLFITMLCCNDTSPVICKNTIVFNRNDFREQICLSNPDTIITEALNPLFYHIIRDSMILISNKDDSQLLNVVYIPLQENLNVNWLQKEQAPMNLFRPA